MIRTAVFITTNLMIMLLIGFFLVITGMYSHNVAKMMFSACCIGFGGSFASLFLSQWIAIRSVNGRIIEKPSNEYEHWLVNTIQNQVNMVGVKMPKVVIYPANDINAFATGSKRNQSLVAVSSGLLQNMNNSEVEAVLAHEISHIDNGDMVMMTLIQGVLNTFVVFFASIIATVISTIIANIFFSNIKNHENNKHLTALNSTISSALMNILGTFASIVAMWFSRRREFHADAGAAKLVGAEKMIAALERLKTSKEPNEPNNIITFCIHGKRNSWFELFMSHPPLDQRIDALRKQYFKSTIK
ncbi:protease HtpX [Candidatus Pantoea edessiphila]|uniref:Protease HtpX n=1 Tax=Candidatus Pantoea edessiphila TaxID=2044610 RepID=A0A2P5T2P4_9GAMM|nr:protease HtpX [Candidatus Pantoea edessiphila]PPI88848.1 protease HtpX [Candidatus Pantoea edessiphila]